jgi:hypothetical protein
MHFNDPYQPHHIINNLFIFLFSFFLLVLGYWAAQCLFIYYLLFYYFKGLKFGQIEENSRDYSVVIFLFFL